MKFSIYLNRHVFVMDLNKINKPLFINSSENNLRENAKREEFELTCQKRNVYMTFWFSEGPNHTKFLKMKNYTGSKIFMICLQNHWMFQCPDQTVSVPVDWSCWFSLTIFPLNIGTLKHGHKRKIKVKKLPLETQKLQIKNWEPQFNQDSS